MINDTVLKASINIITVIEKEIVPLKIDLKVGFIFSSTNPHYQAVLLERARILINVIFNNSIFVNRENKLCDKLKKITSTPVVECWNEPWDQFIALLFYYKLSAIIKDKAFIDFINITGDALCDDLEYTYHSDMLNTEITDEDLFWINKKKLKSLWYHREDTSVNEDNNKKQLTWEMRGLAWKKQKPKKSEESEEPYVNNIIQFKPKIVK